MKFMSYACALWEVEREKEWLTKEVGVTIFKVDYEYHKHPNLRQANIIFYVPDKELETMIKLKYPPNTFKYCMA